MLHARRLDRMLVVLSIALVAWATPTAAQPSRAPRDSTERSDKDKKLQARRYVDSGLAAHEAGDYDTALLFFAKAYELIPHPVLLFNMAQSHRLAGRLDQALELYRRYLAAEPDGTISQNAREFAASLEGKVAAEAARKAEEQRAAEAARRAEEQRAAEAAREAEQRERRLRWAGIGTGGAGLLSLGIALAYDHRARSLSDELSRPGAVYDPRKVDDGTAAELRSHVALAVGGALVAGGVALFVIGHRRSRAHAMDRINPVSMPGRSARATLAPLPISGGLGLAISGGLP